MRCAKCGAENLEGYKFCTQCGTALGVVCAKCGTTNPGLSKFCGHCGTALSADDGSVPPTTSSRSASDSRGAGGKTGSSSAEGERRHLTVLFCDLVNSTAIESHLDPEEWHDLAAGFQRNAADAITRLGGHVAKFLGDVLMAYFGWPEAHEDDAVRAVRASPASSPQSARSRRASRTSSAAGKSCRYASKPRAQAVHSPCNMRR